MDLFLGDTVGGRGYISQWGELLQLWIGGGSWDPFFGRGRGLDFMSSFYLFSQAG